MRSVPSSLAASTAACTDSADVTSVSQNSARSPSSFSSALPRSAFLSTITVVAPAPCRRRIVPSPRPEAPPVTSATAPSICMNGTVVGFGRVLPMAVTNFDSPKALLDAVGSAFGPTDWLEIAQDRIDKFADATGDYQWIHVDSERAKAGPFGAPIAHGYLTLSLCGTFLAELASVSNISMGINYGVNKARFITPVKVGKRVRARGELVEAAEVAGGVQAVIRVTVEIEGEDKPAAVVDTVSRYLA